MTRNETTRSLTDILISDRLSDRKYYAQEVTLDYGTDHSKRVDVMQFSPAGVIYASDIEKGIFTCYEIKSCKADVYSGNGLNFLGEKNYIVTTIETYKKLQEDIREGVLRRYVKDNYPESSLHFGIMCPVPIQTDCRKVDDLASVFDNPPELGGDPYNWKLHAFVQCHEGRRSRSMNELLFCMLRSKHNCTNMTQGKNDLI